MNRFSLSVTRACGVAVLSLVVSAGAMAQDAPRKPPPQLPPNPVESSRIPTGVDLGTPATSKGVPLGTPVPPSPGADRGELKTRSAAARAAARPKAASGVAASASGGAAAEAAAKPSADCPSKTTDRSRQRPGPGTLDKGPGHGGCV